jgi:plastocyanin
MAWFISSAVGQEHADHQPGSDPETVRIIVKNNQFNGGVPVTVRVGDSVVWVNQDLMPHTASSTSASAQDFNTGFIQPGKSSEPITFLKESGANGFPYECDVHDAVIMKGTVIVKGEAHQTHHESPSIHSMLVTGKTGDDIFLHHYALFNNPNHTYHVTLEAKIDDPKLLGVYNKWRAANGDAMCAVDPEVFLLPEIKSGQRTSFKGKLSETARPGGVETQWGTVIPGLEDVPIRIVRIIQFRMFDPAAVFPERLTYQLFGNANEVYLAHEVTAAPSFQQVVKLKDVPAFLTKEIIASSPLVVFPSKQLRRDDPVTLKTAVLSNSTHLVLAPPFGTLNPTPPLADGEQVEVLIGSDPTLRKITIGHSIWYEFRIINR